ncbi:hypothetical protein EDC01DRAFT_191436 [Geopyxis carbonaria]|nr:hypothetical protein EDC01DRAFT_191436 [Geopyxis carbonaria]
MPASATSYASNLHFTSHPEKPPLAVPNGSTQQPLHNHQHASALPQFGEYVVESPSISSPAAPSTSVWDKENFVFCDPVAFRYIEEDTCTTVVCRNQPLFGYEIYIVEQWACSRSHPTFVISTYTGDKAHRVQVSVLQVPKDQEQWSVRFKAYFDAVKQYGARPKDTELGTLMVTNLSSFPSSFTVVPVPEGDVKQKRMDFIVNEDLKRMGCSGRSALSLAVPTDATQARFHQLFKTSDRLNIYLAVVELVRLCQLALMTFEKLPLNPKYADGLLCDITEKGIRDWWAEFGTDYYNVEPNDGNLGPTTVAALLGMFMGARNRLSLCGAPAPKDAFDLPQLEKAINHFQRQQRIDRTSRLDRVTMARLQRVTMKSSSTGAGDIFAVPRAIRSTVADLSARAVGNTSGNVDATSIETIDLDKFIQHISGESCKYLWQGKPRKTVITGSQSNAPSRRNSIGGGSLSGDEAPTQGISRESTESPRSSIIIGAGTTSHGHQSHPSGANMAFSSSYSDRDPTGVSNLRKAMIQTMTGRMKDVASGISAGTDYIRGRGSGSGGHQRTLTKDSSFEEEYALPSTTSAAAAQAGAHHYQRPAHLRRYSKPDVKSSAPPSPRIDQFQARRGSAGRATTESPGTSIRDAKWSGSGIGEHSLPKQFFPESSTANTSLKSLSDVLDEPSDTTATAAYRPSMRLTRRKSFPATQPSSHNDDFFPRRFSFSLAEDTVLSWSLPFAPALRPDDDTDYPLQQWTSSHIASLEATCASLDKHLKATQSLVTRKQHELGVAEREGGLQVEAEKQHLRDTIREAEMLGARMEYEVNAVESRIRDLEEAVSQWGRFVEELEDELAMTVKDDEGQEKRRGWIWWPWGLRWLLGIS